MKTAEDPFARFARIFERATALGIEHPNAVHLATVDAAGRPAVRVVLLKGFDERGFVFYTNFESAKGDALAARPYAELNFYWRELGRQIRVAGPVSRVANEEADAYFATRARLSQLGAWASRQSRPLPSHARLLAEVARTEGRFLGRDVPRPPFWGGYRLAAERFEFWRVKPFRLHDRTEYTKSGDGWQVRNLYP
ncbi:MAG: pyridoxamine 5'-phosphate oxidase [Acidobacteriota bacterium]|nr:pyridoxamine 5'-phosphate oxidase [Acidobacteriota bacterium]MDH3522750.1 pyridoxamine 5'-phosphate oxidase [Acidobacteriota bacterium]